MQTDAIPASPELARHIAATVARLDIALVPESVQLRATHLILDAVGVAYAARIRKAGSHQEAAIAAWSPGLSGNHAVIGSAHSLSARDAACLNGELIHSLEFDDVHMGAVLHATSAIFPAALATGELVDALGRDLLLSYIAGVEIAARLGMSSTGGFQRRGFHPTSVVGTFSATIAAGILLKLTEDQMVHAQGIALSLASGSMQFLEGGGDTKRLHAGWAAQAGMHAAMLAKHGMSGPKKVYEGKHGLFAMHVADTPDVDMLHQSISTIGNNWEVDHVAIKPFPAAYYAHACIEAAIDLAHYDDLAPAQIESVDAWVPEQVLAKIAEPIAEKRRPSTTGQAQFSLPYLIAVGLIRRQFTLHDLDDATRLDPAVLNMAQRVVCKGDPNTKFPETYPGRLEIKLVNGDTLSKEISVNLGAQARPVANDFILSKFLQNVPNGSGQQAAQAILSLIDTRSARRFGQTLATIGAE